MICQLGDSPWILILITFFELVFLIIPPFIASKVEHNTLKEQLIDLGFSKSNDSILEKLLKIISGLGLSIIFVVLAHYLFFFFTYISELIYGINFVDTAQKGIVSTSPINPNFLQLVIIIFQQILIIGLCEEAFFRSFLIRKLNNKFRYSVCIIISSLLFAFYHVPPFIVPWSTIITYFGYYFTFGVILSIIFLFYKKSLLPVVISHGFFNSFLVMISFFN